MKDQRTLEEADAQAEAERKRQGSHLSGIFPHPCGYPTCSSTVPYDDERYCFTHSPDSGSYTPYFSAREVLVNRAKAAALGEPEEYVEPF